jgi:hypothetical protein
VTGHIILDGTQKNGKKKKTTQRAYMKITRSPEYYLHKTGWTTHGIKQPFGGEIDNEINY